MKTIKDIQEENRKFILEATLSGNNLRILREGISDFSNTPLTLPRVLLALDFIYTSGGDNNWIIWDLAKETLEEQSEEMQRGINELFITYEKNT